jgi:hypothetical protein
MGPAVIKKSILIHIDSPYPSCVWAGRCGQPASSLSSRIRLAAQIHSAEIDMITSAFRILLRRA